ncbi:hypothetical protein EJ110_NYTH58222 [Nymphaea thermarum]|nr:hypothetical protein EJ110_NYTH58222 [Nymphaea thermarum]
MKISRQPSRNTSVQHLKHWPPSRHSIVRWHLMVVVDRWRTHSIRRLGSLTMTQIGHLLGSDHSSVPEAAMYPSLKPQTRKVELHADDIASIKALYPDG